ncbi:MAG: DUF2795 domain-containing protein [Acidimicrobiia bacterium]
MSQPVTRLEIADAVRTAFEGGGATREEIVEAAAGSGSRPEVAEALTGLTVRRYSRLNEIWVDLAEIPVEV